MTQREIYRASADDLLVRLAELKHVWTLDALEERKRISGELKCRFVAVSI